MQNLIAKLLGIIQLAFVVTGCQVENTDKLTEIIRNKDSYRLLYKGEPYFIKGARANQKFELVKEYGGNSVRTGSLDRSKLDELEQLGLTALYGLPVMPERRGMDYDDEVAVQTQFDKVISRVNEVKDHPAILIWVLGNELDYVDPETPPNWKVYDAINDLAREIHQIDPTRPVLTVLGTGKKWKLTEFIKRCPDMDLVGINAYADIGEVPGWLEEYGYDKPFVMTEWGPLGHWQVPRTDFGVELEQNSTEKANSYKTHYEKVISANPKKCLGSYVFLWWQHQERTHTWYGMFDAAWRETSAVDVMREMWTGNKPYNLAPEIVSFRLDGKVGEDNLRFSGKEIHTAVVIATDPDGDELVYDWEVLPENTIFGYGGGGEKKPLPADCIISDKNREEIEFVTPDIAGKYRVFVYVYDKEGNHFSYSNIPFLVK